MGHASSRRGRLAPALLAVLAVLALSACGGAKPAAVAPAPSIAATPTDPEVAATGLPDGVDVEVVDSAPGIENGANLDFVSPVYTVTPVGPLDEDATVSLRLDNALPATTPLLVATRALDSDPWSYRTGTLTSDQRHVEFQTRDLDQMGVLAVDLDGLLTTFRSHLHTALSPPKRAKVVEPTCAGEDEARQAGYAASATSAKTLYWCLGLRNGKRVLEVTNRRAFPVQVTHADLDVVQPPEAVAAYATWAKVLGDEATLLAPGRTATYDAELEPPAKVQVVAASSAEAQSLRVFLAGTRALVATLHGLGISSPQVAPTVKRLLGTPYCARSLAQGVEAVVAHCFSQGRLTRLFGSRALLLAPLLTSETFPAVLADKGAALTKQAAAQRQRVVVRRSAPDFSALVGLWSGKNRLLAANGEGLVTEKVYNDTGKLVIQLTYQLGYPVTEDGTTTVEGTVTAVKVGVRKLVKGALPEVGATGTLSVGKGVIRPPFLKTSYCDAKAAKKGSCGT